MTLRRHFSDINDMDISRDDSLVASCCGLGHMRVWRIYENKWTPVCLIEMNDRITVVRFSEEMEPPKSNCDGDSVVVMNSPRISRPKRTLLITASDDGYCRIYDTYTLLACTNGERYRGAPLYTVKLLEREGRVWTENGHVAVGGAFDVSKVHACPRIPGDVPTYLLAVGVSPRVRTSSPSSAGGSDPTPRYSSIDVVRLTPSILNRNRSRVPISNVPISALDVTVLFQSVWRYMRGVSPAAFPVGHQWRAHRGS
eukprot:GHVO01041302.1.p1 GENE.GHVO01041302.1~~GHVO01041302.1.p1  ORF type:complete len:287 (+),score=56.38 GHVO01041302.1:99-863(+)